MFASVDLTIQAHMNIFIILPYFSKKDITIYIIINNVCMYLVLYQSRKNCACVLHKMLTYRYANDTSVTLICIFFNLLNSSLSYTCSKETPHSYCAERQFCQSNIIIILLVVLKLLVVMGNPEWHILQIFRYWCSFIQVRYWELLLKLWWASGLQVTILQRKI